MTSPCGRIESRLGILYLDGKKTNFLLKELVSKVDYEQHKEHCVHFIRPQALHLLQFTREFLGIPLTVNTWHIGGTLNWRGYRSDKCKIGAKTSMHRYGFAYDFSCSLSPDAVRKIILDNASIFIENGLTRLESGAFAKTWVHMDCKHTGLDHILIVAPSVLKPKSLTWWQKFIRIFK